MNSRVSRFLVLIVLSVIPLVVQAMGLRSFVALPVNQGGAVFRLQYLANTDTDLGIAFVNAALGLTGKDTLLFGLPYRITPTGGDRVGDISALYRRTIWQDDRKHSTTRVALLTGVVLATDSKRDNALQLGMVATFYRDRHSFDVDALYRYGMGSRPDDGRYDVSWQYRLSPSEYPDWGFPTEWYSVVELNGRWRDGDAVDHQLTAGLQWIRHNWVVEGGVIQTINNDHETQYLLSTRLHF